MDTELEALGETMTEAHYQEMVQALTGRGVSLTDPITGQLRSTYDVLKDIAAVWDTMNPNEQSALAEALSGNRQRNVFASIIQNFQDAEGAMEAMQHSAGALDEAYTTYMDSISANINQFKAALAEFMTGFVDTNFLNGIIDTGTDLVELFTDLTEKGLDWYKVVEVLTGAMIAFNVATGNYVGAVIALLTEAGVLYSDLKSKGVISDNISDDAQNMVEQARVALETQKAEQELKGLLDRRQAAISSGDDNELARSMEELEKVCSEYGLSLDELIDLYDQYAVSAQDVESQNDDLVDSYKDLAGTVQSAHSSISALTKELSGADVDDDYAAMKKVVDTLGEIVTEGRWGDWQLSPIQDILGISGASPEETIAYYNRIKDFYTDDSKGLANWLEEIRRLNEEGVLNPDILGWDGKDTLTFDEDHIQEMLDGLNMSAEQFAVMIARWAAYSHDFADQIDMDKVFGFLKTVEDTNSTDIDPKTVELDTDGALSALNSFDDALHKWAKESITKKVTISVSTDSGSSNNSSLREALLRGKFGPNSTGSAALSATADDALAAAANALNLGFNAAGTTNAKRGLSLLGDEYSPDGTPRPELVVGKNGAYIAGLNGPTVSMLNDGDVVYPYSDTARILSGTDIQALRAFKAGAKIGVAPGSSPRLIEAKTLIGKLSSHTTSHWDPNKSGSDSGSGGGGGGGGGSAAQEAEDTLEKIDWIVVALDRAQRAVKALEKVATSTFRNISTRLGATYGEMEKIRHEIDLQQQAAVRYQQEADSVGLSEDLAQLVRDGTIDIRAYDEETRGLISEYQKWYEASINASEAVDDLHENLASLYTDNFSNVQKDYDNQLSLIEHGADMLESNLNALEAKGRVDTVTYYQKMQDIEKQNISVMEAELQDLRKYMDEAMKSGEIEEYSEAWYDMQTSINGVEKALADANVNLLEYSKSMREVEWGQFDAIRDRISDITKETNFLMELMGDSGLVNDQGGFTDAGAATMGLHAINFDTYMAQADAYAEELRKIESDIANDPNNNDLIKRRRELLDLQRESISAANDEKQAMVDLVKEGIDAQLAAMKNLIDSYKESLDEAKDLHDYQKKITEKTSAIATLEKQIAAYSGDTSEENKSRLQKLTTELTKAQDDLAETEQERTLSEQKKMLDQLYEEYEDVLNSRLDDIDALITEMIEATNMNADAIKTTLETEAGKVGYALTDVAKLFQSGGAYDGLVSTYAPGFDEKLNSINLFVKDITSAVTAMASAAGLELTDVKGYASGGLVDDTGYIKVHGSSAKPELVLNAEDTKNFLLMRDAFKSLQASSSHAFSGLSPAVPGLGSSGGNGAGVGNVTIQVDIDHVQDYNEFVQQMQRDPKVEKLIQAVSVDRMYGKGPLQKYHINFGN